jgi:hypothetical protein
MRGCCRQLTGGGPACLLACPADEGAAPEAAEEGEEAAAGGAKAKKGKPVKESAAVRKMRELLEARQKAEEEVRSRARGAGAGALGAAGIPAGCCRGGNGGMFGGQ